MDSISRMGPRDYRLGTSYAIATALLMSFQAPFSAFAARALGSLDFMAFTQLALLFSITLLILRADSRRDFVAIMFRARNWPKLAVVWIPRLFPRGVLRRNGDCVEPNRRRQQGSGARGSRELHSQQMDLRPADAGILRFERHTRLSVVFRLR